MKFWLKACPRCEGDLELKREITGPYIECVQCGLELDRRQVRSLLAFGYVPDAEPIPAPPVAIEGRRHIA